MNNKILMNPSLRYADELRDICKPLIKLDISYFGYACLDQDHQLSVLNNHPTFMEHYLVNHYYNADIHAAKFSQATNYIILDSIKLTGLSKKINLEAIEHGVRHLFTIIEKDHLGTHYYHFANDSTNNSINQFYINNISLLTLFNQYFKNCIGTSKHLMGHEKTKFNIDNNLLDFTTNDELHLTGVTNNYAAFLSDINTSFSKALTPQQDKCVKLLVLGLSAKQIASKIDLSTRTVENYLAAARQQLKCSNSKELIAHYFKYLKN